VGGTTSQLRYKTNSIKPRDTIMLPVSSITRRIVVEYGHEVEQRLVLWASWE
jgi:hypothetical protein